MFSALHNVQMQTNTNNEHNYNLLKVINHLLSDNNCVY